ncbi:MAG TPA: hypothetical protein DEH78_27740 [Solibacterales bacterium]|nr:hypothetical protein [Bryobacterales bacterium]
MPDGFRERLLNELHARRSANPRYSLRAFASFLGADHATLSQALRGKRPIPAASIRAWGQRLGLLAEETAAYVAAQRLQATADRSREEELRHWSAEALAVIGRPEHWRLYRLAAEEGFDGDSRRRAQEWGVSVDEVNVALARLLRLGLIATGHQGVWRATEETAGGEAEFRRLALTRIREKQWRTP